jgi:hypothetical protein
MAMLHRNSPGSRYKNSVVRSSLQDECKQDYKNGRGSSHASPNQPGWSINESYPSMNASWDFNNWK